MIKSAMKFIRVRGRIIPVKAKKLGASVSVGLKNRQAKKYKSTISKNKKAIKGLFKKNNGGLLAGQGDLSNALKYRKGVENAERGLMHLPKNKTIRKNQAKIAGGASLFGIGGFAASKKRK